MLHKLCNHLLIYHIIASFSDLIGEKIIVSSPLQKLNQKCPIFFFNHQEEGAEE